MLAVAVIEWTPTSIAAAVAAVFVIGKAVHWFYEWARKIDDSLEYVREELSFNSGTTTRDAIKRIETRLDRIERHQNEVAVELQTFRHASTSTVRSVREDVSTLLEHDAERDVPGARYEGNPE